MSTRQTILDHLADTLLPTITTGGSYNFTVQTVNRGWRDPEELDDGKFPAIYVTQSEEIRQNITHNKIKSELNVILIGMVRTTNGINDVQKEMDKLIEDVTKVLETDRTQGNRVHWTEIKRITTDFGDNEPYGVVRVDVQFVYAVVGTSP